MNADFSCRRTINTSSPEGPSRRRRTVAEARGMSSTEADSSTTKIRRPELKLGPTYSPPAPSPQPLAPTREPQRSPRELAVVEAGAAIELGDERRELDREAPLIGPPALFLDGIAPAVPPRRNRARQRF